MSLWTKYTQQVTKDAVEVESKPSLPASLEGSDPELCIALFKSTLNFHGLKKRITSADKKWIEEFLDQEGLETLFDALATLGMKGFNTSTALMDAVQQLECIKCIKTIMSRSCGMEHILTNGEKFVKRLIEGNCDVIQMKHNICYEAFPQQALGSLRFPNPPSTTTVHIYCNTVVISL